MKLTIIPSDGAVYENGVCYSGLTWEGTPANVHALQWVDVAGWIEYKDQPSESIDALPEWALNAEAAWTEANTPKPPVPPTEEQNKQTAIALLAATDWVNQPDVRNTANNPHLLNGPAFDDYRVAVRIFAVYPVAGDVNWPIKPDEIWSDPFANLP